MEPEPPILEIRSCQYWATYATLKISMSALSFFTLVSGLPSGFFSAVSVMVTMTL